MKWRLVTRSEPLRRSVSAATQRHDVRRRIFVELSDAGYTGYGEVSPLAFAVAGDPGVDEVYEHLATVALERVSEVWRREGTAPRWSRIPALALNSTPSRWAHAAIEMAVLDWEMQGQCASLAASWAVDPEGVGAMATVSLLDDVDSWHVAHNSRRLRVKTTFGVDPSRHLDALAELNVPILLDFNTTARSADEVRRQLTVMKDRVRVDAVEQPFAPGDFISHAELAAQIDVAVSLDESVRSVLDVRQIARYQSASLVCVKPPRVGGLAVARSMISSARDAGLRTYVGGFFESPLARRAHRILAAFGDCEASDVADLARASGGGYEQRNSGIGVYPVLSASEVAGAVVVN